MAHPQTTSGSGPGAQGRRTDRWSLVLAVVSVFTGPFLTMLALALSTAGGDQRLIRLARLVAVGALCLQAVVYGIYALRR